MMVVKLGGSLARTGVLSDCLTRIDEKYRGMAVAIVPGGGAFADQVRLAQRQWRFDDGIAHSMALLAMQQMALMLKGLNPKLGIARSIPQLRMLMTQKKTVVWSPDVDELERSGIEASWDITSDSLAAWLAATLSASELILIKSVNIDAKSTLVELSRKNVIDRSFCDFASRCTGKITIINEQKFLNG